VKNEFKKKTIDSFLLFSFFLTKKCVRVSFSKLIIQMFFSSDVQDQIIVKNSIFFFSF